MYLLLLLELILLSLCSHNHPFSYHCIRVALFSFLVLAVAIFLSAFDTRSKNYKSSVLILSSDILKITLILIFVIIIFTTNKIGLTWFVLAVLCGALEYFLRRIGKNSLCKETHKSSNS